MRHLVKWALIAAHLAFYKRVCEYDEIVLSSLLTFGASVMQSLAII